jgi:TolB-like protein
MLGIALAAVVSTTLAVWVFHFMHMEPSAVPSGRPFPSIAVLPFHSLSADPQDIQSDSLLTSALISGLSGFSRVEALPAEIDADPVAVGQELGVKTMLIGKIERRGQQIHVDVQMISARDGKQLWTGKFDGSAEDLAGLSWQIDKALAPHLTALLD